MKRGSAVFIPPTKKVFLLKGFTLIELLVVIAVIGILSSVVLASLNTSRAKSRDAKRLSDVHQIQNALEIYYTTNNAYPTTAGAWWGNCSTYGSHATSGATGYIPNLAPAYIPVLPLDPKPVSTNGCYLYQSNGTDYMLLVYLTVETYTSSNNPFPRPSAPAELDFAVYTPGGRNY